MRLSELMSRMNLTIYPEVGLVLFLTIFAGVVIYVLRGKQDLQRHGNMPLEDAVEVRHE